MRMPESLWKTHLASGQRGKGIALRGQYSANEFRDSSSRSGLYLQGKLKKAGGESALRAA